MDELKMSQLSLDLSSESDGAGDENPEDNKIDKAFKKLQKKKDNFLRFQKKVKERRAEKMQTVNQMNTSSAVTSLENSVEQL